MQPNPVPSQGDALAMAGIVRFIYEETGHKPHRASIFRWTCQGRLKARRIGKRIYAYPDDIRAMLEHDARPEAQERNARADAAIERIHAKFKAERQAARRAPRTKRGGK